MSQPIFVIDRAKAKEIIQSVADRGGYQYSGLSFGESNPQSMIDMVENMSSVDGLTLNLSTVANAIRALETGKMPGNANAAIGQIIKLINENKKPQEM